MTKLAITDGRKTRCHDFLDKKEATITLCIIMHKKQVASYDQKKNID